MAGNNCRNCVESVIISEEVIQELINEAEEDKSKIVSDEIYHERLQICKGCPSLQYETTCVHNGWIVQYRAKFKNKSCPFPSVPKWEKIVSEAR